MNNTTKNLLKTVTTTVALATSRHGTLEPQITIRIPKDLHFRHLKAALHLVAAEVELATPAREDWIVQTECPADERGRVYLELVRSSADEAQRGLELLRLIAEEARA